MRRNEEEKHLKEEATTKMIGIKSGGGPGSSLRIHGNSMNITYVMLL